MRGRLSPRQSFGARLRLHASPTLPMGRYAPTTQPTSVTTAGAITAVPVGSAQRGRRLRRVVVEYVSGDAATFIATWSTHALVTDKTQSILDLTGGTTTVPLDVTEPANGIVWDDEHCDGNIYVKVTPNAGTNNAFRVAAYLD